MIITGKHSGPFYFIPMISIIFLLSIFLFRIQKSRYFDAVAFGIIGAGLFTYAYGYYATLAESLFYFLPVYIFGMWASRNRKMILGMTNPAMFFLIILYLIIFTFEITQVIDTEHLQFFESTPHYLTTHINWSKLKEMILAVILLIFFYRSRNAGFHCLAQLGSFSFGIYFLHIYFINAAEHLLDHFYISRLQQGLGFLVLTIIVVAASIFTVYIVKLIFKNKSRILIGS
jgi:peptidoglycan/LPS O-acetylase OafA/YrhL